MRRRFPEAFEPILTAEIGEVDCAYVDVNELIHHVVRRATDNDELVRLTLRRVSELLRATPPRRLAVLAIDGPGPLAKVFTQRQRRRKTAAKAERKQGAPQGVDTLSLSPGTPFMLELSDALESFARRRVAFAGGLEQQPAYIVSGAHVAGEGEVKCVEHLLDATEECTPAELTHVLHGSDSDLLLLALAAGVSRVSVAAPVRLTGAPGVKRAAPRYDVFSADACSAALHALLPPNGPSGRRALDLVCVAILASGNDYMPALQSATLDSAFRAYCDLARGTDAAPAGNVHLVRIEREREGGRAARARVDRAALCALLLALHEGRALRAPTGTPTATAPPLEQQAVLAPAAELHAAEAYVRALEWVLSQYVTGRCPDFGLTAVSSPALPALYAVLSAPPPSDEAARAVAAPPRAALPRPPIPAVYNLLVQPSAGQAVVPHPLRSLMAADSPIGWLYTQGCTCAECARLHTAMIPLMRAVQEIAPLRDDPAVLARFDGLQAELRELGKEERLHLDAEHDGFRLMHAELPSIAQVEALVAQAGLNGLSAQERRTLALAEPVRIGRATPAPAAEPAARPAAARQPARQPVSVSARTGAASTGSSALGARKGRREGTSSLPAMYQRHPTDLAGVTETDVSTP
ncbi:hypothetical protein KFE25_009120 [Diacronema lutheri]|uniref:Xrn1 N-terminal domain-containing protein n=1 Tax=Diacronema lutheri TaxID=2081491 RepID=A0A8J5XU90_DIALT|nr:hypothetical protein KFE25_009120 [Diacronema lutheri]